MTYCDAMQIILAEADTVALKDNHPQLYDDVNKGALAIHETVDNDHGRIEIRR